MTTKAYPDGLPFGRIVRFGLPFHGIVKGGDLTLPDATTMTYPQPVGGDITYVKHPLAALPTRTAAEIAWDALRNYQWLDYAYLSGYHRSIGGVDFTRTLTNPTTDYWLYCSATKTWLIRATRQTLSGKVRITLAARRFGQFAVPRNLDTLTFADIGAHEFAVKNYDDNNVTNAGGVYYLGATHKRDGSVSVLNFRYSPNTTDYFADSFQFCGAIKLTISGDEADELAVAGLDLCIGSQIATVVETDETLGGNYALVNFGASQLDPEDTYANFANTAGTLDTIKETPISQRQFECPGGGYGCEAEAAVALNLEGAGYSAYRHETRRVETKYYVFVTPSGTIDNFSSEYTYGSTWDHEFDTDFPSSITVYKLDNCGIITVSSPVTVSGSTNTVSFDGVSASYGLSGAVVIDGSYSKTVTTDRQISIEIFANTCFTSMPAGEMHGENGAGSQTTSIVYNRSGELSEELDGFEALTIYASVHNNNIVDFWHKDPSTSGLSYIASMTILGEKFDRDGKNAVMDPKTGTVHLSDNASQSISIV